MGVAEGCSHSCAWFNSEAEGCEVVLASARLRELVARMVTVEEYIQYEHQRVGR
jgi:hypothetical protein